MISALALAAVLIVPHQRATARDGWLGTDKVKHFFMSAFVQSAAFSASRAAGMSRSNAQRIAGVTTVAVGIQRELYDKRRGRRFSGKDLVWDVAGGFAAASLLQKTRDK